MKNAEWRVKSGWLVNGLAGLLVGWLANGLSAATIHVDASVNKRLTADGWTALGVTRPDYEFYFASANGLDYDTTGADSSNQYRNTGQTGLVTGLTDGNRPSLTEGVLQPHQGGLAFNGSTNYLYINDASVMRPTTNDFGAGFWARWTDAGANVGFIGKYNTTPSTDREWNVRSTVGKVRAFVFQDAAGNHKDYQTNTAYHDGDWHFIYISWISDVFVIYVDGAEAAVTKNTDNTITEIYSTPALPAIGGYYSGGVFGNYLSMDLAWAGYWQGAGTPDSADQAAIYTAMKATGASDSPYPTLQAAVYQGAAGDTILVNDGRYQETITVATAFDYIGSTTTTFGNWAELYGANLPAAAGFVGLTVTVDNEVGFLEVRGYPTVTTGIGILATSTSDGSLFHHLAVDSCRNGVDFDGACDGDSLINCTIDGGGLGDANGFRATTSATATVVVKNTIVLNTNVGLTKATLQTLTETNNCFFNNTTNYSGSLDATDQLRRPIFFGGNDFRLARIDRLNELGELIHAGESVWLPVGKPAIGAFDAAGAVRPSSAVFHFARSCPWARPGGAREATP